MTNRGESATSRAERILGALPDAVVVIDTAGVVQWANETAVRIMGRPLDEWIGTNGLSMVHPDDLAIAALSLTSVQSKLVGTPVELRVATANGWRVVELVGATLSGDEIVLSMRDLTERRRWEVAGDDVARFRSLVHNAPNVTMLLSADGTVQSVSASVTRKLGQDQEALCDRPLFDIVDEADHALLRDALARAVAGPAGDTRTPVSVELSLRDSYGDVVPFEFAIVSLLDDPTVEGLVASGHEITRLRHAQQLLYELANQDPVTALPNRRAFEAAMQQVWGSELRANSYVVVADLDHFKQLNDEFGHAAGDEALRAFAHTLKLVTRDGDVVARIGGDEFGVILVGCGSDDAATALEARVAEVLANHPCPNGAKVGATVGCQPLATSMSAHDAVNRADLAMLEKKRSRKRLAASTNVPPAG